MDAKKASKVIKPKYLKDTPANAVINLLSAGIVVFTVVCTGLSFYWLENRPNRFIRTNRFSQYLRSDEYKMARARWFHLLPPTKEQEKYLTEREQKEEINMNPLDEDLNESDLFCKTLAQKRKLDTNINPKNSKQLKLNFTLTSNKVDEKQISEDKKLFGEKIKANKSHDWNSRYNESQSGYFSVKNSTSTCPLCLKSFKTDSAYSAHMKQCAKTHKMTTQQLLGALELQKKQMQERRDLGLCSQGELFQKKSAPKKTEKKTEPYDLALGLALSESLTTSEPKNAIWSEAPKSTLEEFGFTSCNTSVGVTGPIKRKYDGNKKPVLKDRTPEDRQRIIIEKVAVVLLDEDKEQNIENKNPNLSFSCQNGQVPRLWNKGESSCTSGWYVHAIKKYMLSEENAQEELTESALDNIENEIAKLNLPQRNISNDWRKIINNKKLSDLVGRTRDGQDVYVHSVVLYVRCPELLEKDYKSIFEKFNLSTVLIFMEYLYCGTLNSLSRTEIDNLCSLATEFDYCELIQILNCLKINLSVEDRFGRSFGVSNSSSCHEIEEKNQEITATENKKVEITDCKDLLAEDLIDLTRNGHTSEVEDSGDSSNAEKSYWSFIQHQKKAEKLEEVGIMEKQKECPTSIPCEEEKRNLKSPQESDKINDRRSSNSSATKDWSDVINDKKAKAPSDCVIVSSGSETYSEENFIKSQCSPRSRTPSPFDLNYEVPPFDPFDNFHCISEEPFSPVGLHSQSLISGNISMESPKESTTRSDGSAQDNQTKNGGYCSTPVTFRGSCKIDPSTKNSVKTRRKRSDLSSSRLLRKSLGLRQKRNSKSSSFKKKRKDSESISGEALANSVLNELSKHPSFESSPPRVKNFIEVTPLPHKEEFADSVTPSPNYSNMEEALFKEHLTKYGLKKNLAKSKAKKILRLIYEELHPLYNTETGKIVKILPEKTPRGGKKSKEAVKSKIKKNGKSKQSKSDGSGKKINTCLNSSKKLENLSKESLLSLDSFSDHKSDESDFESLSETLTQSLPTSPDNLPSAFSEFLQNNPEYHQKILLYEPIWLEELQKKLKEHFKKHFKLSDLMTFLDQKCIAFRSTAQTKKLKKRFEKKKENSRKKKIPSKENYS